MSYCTEAGLSIWLLFQSEEGTKETSSFIPRILWWLFLAPPVVFHIFAGWWALSVVPMWAWIIVIVFVLATIVICLLFFFQGKSGQFHNGEEDILLTILAIGLNCIAFTFGSISVLLGNYPLMLVVVFVQCMVSVLLIPVRYWKY
jgi:hypothetical protein